MISKHIDLIAVAFLLFAILLFSTARHAVMFTLHEPGRFIHMTENPDVRVVIPPAPEMPPMPRIPFQRD